MTDDEVLAFCVIALLTMTTLRLVDVGVNIAVVDVGGT